MIVTIAPPNVAVSLNSNGVEILPGSQIVRDLVGGSLPPGGNPDDVLVKSTAADYDAAWVAPAQRAEQDNTRPITSAAVFTEIGNINALLATI